MAYGLTALGFVPKTTEIIRAEMEADARTAFGASVPLGDKTFLGQTIGIVSSALGELWEVAEQVAASQDPDAATGAALVALAALTGTIPEPARESAVTLTLTGVPATVVDEGSRVATESTGVEFVTQADATIATLIAWAATTAYVVGDIRSSNSRAYIVITAGTSGVLAGSPSGTSDDFTDGTVHWAYLGDGIGAVEVAALSADTGPIEAGAGDLTVIITPLSGWTGVTNLEDAILGANVETDGELRARRVDELASGGNSPVDAIRADLLRVTGVTSVTVFENVTDVTDGDGMPPHSVEALVRGGDEQDICDQLLASVAAGIRTYGTTTGAADDDEGTTHVIQFSRPDEVEIYVIITVVYDADEYPTDGDDQIKAAIVAWGDDRPTGHNAYAAAIGAQAFTVAGVLDVTSTLIDDAPAPGASTTVAISLRELAVYATVRITVNSSSGTP